MHEIERDGQVFVVHHRVKDIYDIANRIQFLCPGVKVAFGHGQMQPEELEDVMMRFINGEFDKATSYYEKLYSSQSTKIYFTRYLECLIQIKDFKTAEKTIKKYISQNKNDMEIQVVLGQFYEDIDEPQKSAKVYEELLSVLSADPGEIINLYQLFVRKTKFDLAKKVLDKGKKNAPYYPFNFQYADLYSLTGNNRLMIEEYINYLILQPSMFESIQNAISSRIDLSKSDGKDYLILKEIIIFAQITFVLDVPFLTLRALYQPTNAPSLKIKMTVPYSPSLNIEIA
jgi:hypothetical protein